MRNASSGNAPKRPGKKPPHSSVLRNSSASVSPRKLRGMPLSNALRRLVRNKSLPKHNAAQSSKRLPKRSAVPSSSGLPKRSGVSSSKRHNKKPNNVNGHSRRPRRPSVGLNSRKCRRLASVRPSRQSKLKRPRNRKSVECLARHHVRNDQYLSSHATERR